MAKGQMRSNKEKKKPKQDKNKDKGAAAPSPFANMHSQTNPNPYGKKLAGAARQPPSPARGGPTREARRGGVVRRGLHKPSAPGVTAGPHAWCLECAQLLRDLQTSGRSNRLAI